MIFAVVQQDNRKDWHRMEFNYLAIMLVLGFNIYKKDELIVWNCNIFNYISFASQTCGTHGAYIIQMQ